ncbi:MULTISPECIES: winged helix-turn-helix domain-containing protein [unclassified Rhizobacter]|uniref:ATP-binding protein n=1 Tax=unclassified Rhizobacter TaxID=2640088 RepID=UPI0007007D9E|nr:MULTISPECIES: winged helix-turn-helix domain-containing protein [unclassified Rhizobacter]KQU80395.1 hypothetical protein ASC88_17375 [Rhizobacter sp. Root29]KQW13893.1 hypothetical protein ASC98_17505 [Rhizobacter sp. Root1238]KRB15717.1 hypothetical protein ASE08_26625 [Rhizobacter sp. Root16D2]
MGSATASIRYRFGRFDVQPAERCLRADGVPVHLGGQAFDVLVVMLERAGHLVTKRDLLARVWDGVVVEENSLQAQISSLRKIVGREAIETVSGQGYRFAVPVRTVGEPAAASAPPDNLLPQALTTFIGREKEISEIRLHLETTRLLTLTGPGGCGKSRLALQVAGTAFDAYPGGVRLVELAPLGDPTLVEQAVAKALDIAVVPGQSIVETIIEWLKPRRVVLVLDNAEHVLETCATLVDALLRRCPSLVVVATSRERLRVDGELTYLVPSLSLPASDDVRDILACEAVRLFIDRARLLRQDFNPTQMHAQALASICRQLDGIALALELAAPQLRIMSLDALDARLASRFTLLTGGLRTALPRHRTLRALIDWSHDLLSEPERVVLRRASVFAGGWTLEGAERVCGGSGIDVDDVPGLLGSLVDKNLIVADVTSESTRFRMLETVREYAKHHLRLRGEVDAVHGRLTACVLDLAMGLDAAQDSVLQDVLRRLDAEHGNLRVALAWCESEPARSMDGLRLAALLENFWRVRGLCGEGLAWLSRLQPPSFDGQQGEIRALALHTTGTLLGVYSDQATAAARLREAVQLWKQLGDRRRAARSLVCLAEVEWYGGNAEAARQACAEALPISRELCDWRNAAEALLYSAEMARIAGDYDAAEKSLQECLALGRDIGGWVTAAAHAYTAALMYSRGDHERSRATWRKSLPGYREFGDRQGTCAALMSIAMISQELGEVVVATSHLREALDCLPGAHDNELLYWLDAFAALLVAHDGAADAGRVWGCVARHREERRLERPDSTRYQRRLSGARDALKDDLAFDLAWSEGRLWSLDEAERFARHHHVWASR